MLSIPGGACEEFPLIVSELRLHHSLPTWIECSIDYEGKDFTPQLSMQDTWDLNEAKPITGNNKESTCCYVWSSSTNSDEPNLLTGHAIINSQNGTGDSKPK